MKKIVLVMMAVMIAFSSIAQSNKSDDSKELRREGRHFKGAERYEKLNLSDEQKAQMKTLSASFRQQMQELKNDNKLSAEDQKSRRMALAKEHQQKVSAILTPEQREQAKELKKDFNDDRKDNKKDGVRGNRFDKMSKELNLSQDQSNKMAVLNESFKKNIKNIKQNTALNQEEKKEQMKSIHQKHRADMENLLTSDQKKQLKSQHKSRTNRNAVK